LAAAEQNPGSKWQPATTDVIEGSGNGELVILRLVPVTRGCLPMRILLLPIALACLFSTAYADPRPPEGKGQAADQWSNQSPAQTAANHGATDADQLPGPRIDRATARRLAIDHQLVGQQALPPGIRKNLARGKPLPPGIAKRFPPANFIGQLPEYPGYEWLMTGSDLVLAEAVSGIVADVLMEVFE